MSDHPRLASRMLPPTAAPAAPSVPSLAPSLSDKLSADAVLATAVLQPGSSYVPWFSSTSTSSSPRPAHNPSKQNAAFGAINISTLQAVSQNQLDRFKRVVRSIPIQFPDTMFPRFRGWSVTTKGDVQHFLDSQVFDIAWQVVLEMAPRETNCNFTATKQFTIESSVPDQIFGLLFADANGMKRFKPCTIAEITAPGYVTRRASVLENARTLRTEGTDDWVAITSQLRKYSVQTCCRDVLVLDERTAIYFQFGEDSNDVEDDIEYLVGSAAHPTTMRQLVAFACWRGLKRKLKHGTFGTGPPSASADIVPCNSILDNNSRGKRSPDGTDESHLKRPRRQGSGNGSAGSSHQFGGWQAGYLFQMAVAPLAAYRTAGSTDSGYLVSSLPHGDTPPKRDFDPPEGTAWRVVDVMSKNVALLECAGHQYIGKWFDVRSDWGEIDCPVKKQVSEVYCYNELTVYGLCHTLQGCEIPHCYGVGEISGIGGMVLIVEYVAGPTVADILHKFREGKMDMDAKWLATLKGSATDAVKALHRFHVVHLDLHGSNMVVLNDTVVIVDFDCSMVFPDGKALREWEDWARLGSAFAV